MEDDIWRIGFLGVDRWTDAPAPASRWGRCAPTGRATTASAGVACWAAAPTPVRCRSSPRRARTSSTETAASTVTARACRSAAAGRWASSPTTPVAAAAAPRAASSRSARPVASRPATTAARETNASSCACRRRAVKSPSRSTCSRRRRPTPAIDRTGRWVIPRNASDSWPTNRTSSWPSPAVRRRNCDPTATSRSCTKARKRTWTRKRRTGRPSERWSAGWAPSVCPTCTTTTTARTRKSGGRATPCGRCRLRRPVTAASNATPNPSPVSNSGWSTCSSSGLVRSSRKTTCPARSTSKSLPTIGRASFESFPVEKMTPYPPYVIIIFARRLDSLPVYFMCVRVHESCHFCPFWQVSRHFNCIQTTNSPSSSGRVGPSVCAILGSRSSHRSKPVLPHIRTP